MSRKREFIIRDHDVVSIYSDDVDYVSLFDDYEFRRASVIDAEGRDFVIRWVQPELIEAEARQWRATGRTPERLTFCSKKAAEDYEVRLLQHFLRYGEFPPLSA